MKLRSVLALLSFVVGFAPWAGAATPNLWTRGDTRTVRVLEAKTEAGDYQAGLACAPGDVFEGSCLVRTGNLAAGSAQIGLRFSLADGTYTYGKPLGLGVPQATALAGPVALAVRGLAPAGATAVMFYLQILKAVPGAEATFERISFLKLGIAQGAAAQGLPALGQGLGGLPNLWSSSPDQAFTATADGKAPTARVFLDCAGGDTFEGICLARTEGQGLAQINMCFTGAGPTSYGAGLDAWTPNVANSEAPRYLAVRGTAPPGATQVMFYVQLYQGQPTAKAFFGQVGFVRRPAQPEATALRIQSFTASRAWVGSGEAVNFRWQVAGQPTALTLKDVAGGISYPVSLEPPGVDGFGPLLNGRNVFRLTVAKGQAEDTKDVSVAVPGIERLAGDSTHVPNGYANGPLEGVAAWRHLSGLLWHGGALYLSEGSDHTIRKISHIDHHGLVEPFAGRRGAPQDMKPSAKGGGRREPQPERLNHPGPMVALGGALYLVDTENHAVLRKEPAKPYFDTYAGALGRPGTGEAPLEQLGLADDEEHADVNADFASYGDPLLWAGPATAARFNHPADLAANPVTGSLYLADANNNRICRIFKDIAMVGSPTWVEAVPVEVSDPQGLALVPGKGGRRERLFVASAADSVIYMLEFTPHIGTKATVVKTVLAGGIGQAGFADGEGSGARFNRPLGLALEPDSQWLLVADAGNNLIRRINLVTRKVETCAGDPLVRASGEQDGDKASARFAGPSRLTFGGSGNLFVVDQDGRALRRIGSNGQVATLGRPRPGPAAGHEDGPGATARFNKPMGVVVDAKGMAFVADEDNHAIRSISPQGDVSTFAGQLGVAGATPHPTSRLEARFTHPTELALDAQDRLYVLEAPGSPLRRIVGDQVTTLDDRPSRIAACPMARQAALVMVCAEADGVSRVKILRQDQPMATVADFKVEPVALAVDAGERVYVAVQGPDTQEVIISQYTRKDGEWKVTGVLRLGPEGEVGVAYGVPRVHGMAADSKGHLFLADSANGVIWKLRFREQTTVAGELRTMEQTAVAVAGDYPFLGPTPEPKGLKGFLYQPHRLAVTPMDDLIVTDGQAVLLIAAPGTAHRPWTEPWLVHGRWGNPSAAPLEPLLRVAAAGYPSAPTSAPPAGPSPVATSASAAGPSPVATSASAAGPSSGSASAPPANKWGHLPPPPPPLSQREQDRQKQEDEDWD